MRGATAPLVLSGRIASDPRPFLEVIDHVLMMDCIKPDLRRRVIRFQQVLIRAELDAHYLAADQHSALPEADLA